MALYGHVRDGSWREFLPSFLAPVIVDIMKTVIKAAPIYLLQSTNFSLPSERPRFFSQGDRQIGSWRRTIALVHQERRCSDYLRQAPMTL